jgi:hypothetical protein
VPSLIEGRDPFSGLHEVRAVLSRRCLDKLHNRALRCAVVPRRQWIGLRDRLCHDERERRDDR